MQMFGRTVIYKRVYIMSPWTLLYADDNYYLLAYDAAEKKDDKKFKYFRVDKMEQVDLLEADRLGGDAYAQIDMKTRTKSTFNMFGGEIEHVTLRFPNFRIAWRWIGSVMKSRRARMATVTLLSRCRWQ